MYAYELEHVLARLFRKSDFHSSEDQAMPARFAALRESGQLPQGREKRGQRLTLNEVAAAILGIVTGSPAWAGHAAICLKSLVPVGGPSAAWGVENLNAAVVLLLSDQLMRNRLIRLTITGSEVGVNSNGSAEMVLQAGEYSERAAFFGHLAFSTQKLGAERTYSFDRRHSESSREVSLNSEFFRKISYDYELSTRLNHPPKGDGSEYNPEEELGAFYKKLGARQRSRYLNVGVETTIQWPRKACQFPFGNAAIVALPPSAKNDASLHIDLKAHAVSPREGRSLLSEALSIGVWLDDQMGMLLDGWAGNPIPLGVHRNTQRHPSSILDSWCNSWQRIDNEKVRLLLGLYREARNLEMTHSIPYALLGYYRIFENLWPKGLARGVALETTIAKILSRGRFDRHEIEGLGLAPNVTATQLADLIRGERDKVAHAKANTDLNPDISDDVGRLSIVASLLRRAAKIELSETMGISTDRWSQTWQAHDHSSNPNP